MKQHVIIVFFIFGILAVILGSITIFANKKSPMQASPSPSVLSLVGLQGSQVPLASDGANTSNAAANATEFKGAIEIEASESANPDAARVVQVTLTNGKSFTMALYEDLAPKTVTNFVKNVSSGIYNGLLIFRVEKTKEGKAGLIQTGDPTNTGSGGGMIQAEYNKRPFIAGSVGIARGQNRDLNSATQFFVMTQALPQLNEEYTNIGMVIEGIEVVAEIKQGQPIQTVTILQ